MTKKEFIEIFGEHPIDVLGGDWKDYITDLSELEKEVDGKRNNPT